MSNTLPEGTAAAFATLCGATVVMIDSGLLPKVGGSERDVPGFTWRCLGCGDGNPFPRDRSHVRQQANDHAFGCRSQPLPAN
jgi:hypothetical protein